MSLNKGKHVIIEIQGTRCSLVEIVESESRLSFLKELLEYNGYKVMVKEEKNDAGIKIFTIGVTDILFNPVTSVYACSLKTSFGKVVSPAYWNQVTTVCDSRYWIVKNKKTSV